MQWNMSDEQFCGLLDWRHPSLAGIDPDLPPDGKALAASSAIRRLVPRTLTIPAHVPRIVQTWQAAYADDVARCRDLIAGMCSIGSPPAAEPRDYAYINDQLLRRMLTHRHQAMVLASRLFALAGERQYVEQVVAPMSRFVAEAPPCPDGGEPAWAGWLAGFTGMDVIWASHVMENWLLALPIVQPALSDEQHLVFLKALACGADFHWRCWRHGFFHNYTRHGVKAAASVGLAWPMFRDARKWLQLGIDRYFGDLTLEPNCLPDGYTRESIGYQCVNAYVTAKWYLLCRHHGVPVPEDYVRRLEAMFEWAAKVVKPDGSHPCQGETTPDSSHEHYILEHELLQLGAVLFDRPDWRHAAGSVRDDRLHPEWLWIVPPGTYERWRALPNGRLSSRRMVSHRSECKIYSLRCGQGLDALCVQTWGLNPRNHGHHDALHLEVYGLGRTVISDAGFAGYEIACRQRDWQVERHSSIHLAGLEPTAKEMYSDAYTREILWRDDEAVAACGLDSALYSGYTIRRQVVLFKAHQTIGVVDLVQPDERVPMPPEPVSCIETRFAFHTPVMGVGRDGLRAWSGHVPGARTVLHDVKDIDAPGEAARTFPWAEICEALGWSDSAANAAVRPVMESQGLSLEIQRGWVCVPGGLVPRPVATYRYRGPLPILQVWEIQLFPGVEPPGAGLVAKVGVDGQVALRVGAQRVSLP